MKATKESVLVTEWEHPNWDMQLILPDDGSRGKPEDYFGEDDDHSQLHEIAHYSMNEDALDALPEWEG